MFIIFNSVLEITSWTKLNSGAILHEMNFVLNCKIRCIFNRARYVSESSRAAFKM